MENNFKKIEKQLRTFFEEKLHLFNDNDLLKMASQQVLDAQKNQFVEKNQKKYTPNIFHITLKKTNAVDTADLESWKSFISVIIKDSAKEHNMIFSGPIHIKYSFDPKSSENVKVDVAFSSSSTSKTSDLMIGDENKNASKSTVNGYLITPQDSFFHLNKKVINIGRQDGNDLVIDNLRVSRVHAQIREINGKHVLFDLDSTVGTKVNNHRITQHTLSTGDVVEIADIALIYGTESDYDNLVQKRTQTSVMPLHERGK